MAGFEFRDKEQLINQYEKYAKPNFSIWAGKQLKICYDGGDLDEGSRDLRDYLTQIESLGTQQTFTLKVYPAAAKNVTTDTGYAGSFNFMLDQSKPVAIDQKTGMMVIDREARTPNPMIAQMENRLQALEKDKEELRERLHKQDMEMMQKDFNAKIAGLSDAANKSTLEDNLLQIGNRIVDKPEIIDKFFEGISKLWNRATRQEVYKPEPAINGTNTMHMNNVHEQETGTDEEEMTPDQEAILERFNKAYAVIVEKVGSEEKVIEALEALASMSAMKLKGFLMML